jgi:hypothetical protein
MLHTDSCSQSEHPDGLWVTYLILSFNLAWRRARTCSCSSTAYLADAPQSVSLQPGVPNSPGSRHQGQSGQNAARYT